MFITWFTFSMYLYMQLTGGLNPQHILETHCGEDAHLRRSLSDGMRDVIVGFGETSLSAFKCRVWLSP